MREVKFRAWNRISKTMRKVANLVFIDSKLEEICVEDGTAIDGVEVVLPEEVTLMQYTGLRDENGKEIYEGDVLGGYESLWIVKYNEIEASFVIYEATDDINWMHLWDAGEYVCRVVGNIYENPELLEGIDGD